MRLPRSAALQSRRRAALAGVVAVVVGLNGTLIGPVAGAVPSRPMANATAAGWRGNGELAVVSGGRLHLLGNAGGSYLVNGPGAPSEPAWSPDGEWVAFLRTPATSGAEGPISTLWVARRDGADAHRLSAAGADVSQFAWGPAGEGEIVAFSVINAPRYTSRILMAAPGSGAARVFGTFSDLIGFNWAPSGDALAISYRTVLADQPGAGTGYLDIAPLDGKAGHTVYTLADNGYVDLASWWPDGKGLLFWNDPAGSASIAADGLSLDSLDLSTLQVRALATTLVHGDWVAWSPSGKTVAVVAGDNREIWYSGKDVELCTIPAAACRRLPMPSDDVMSLDPAWAATGSLIYVLAPAVGPSRAGAPPTTTTTTANGAGWDPSGPWTSQNVTAWYDAQRLFTAGGAGAGPRALAGAPTGAHNPTVTGDGLLYVRDGALWYTAGPAAGGRHTPVDVAVSLESPSPYGNFYGYIAWSEDFAWHR
jgi:hypothetical protein